MSCNIGGSDCSNICLYRDNYAEAKYFTFTMHGGGVTRNMCYCKQDHNLEETREHKVKYTSGNVHCGNTGMSKNMKDRLRDAAL